MLPRLNFCFINLFFRQEEFAPIWTGPPTTVCGYSCLTLELIQCHWTYVVLSKDLEGQHAGRFLDASVISCNAKLTHGVIFFISWHWPITKTADLWPLIRLNRPPIWLIGPQIRLIRPLFIPSVPPIWLIRPLIRMTIPLIGLIIPPYLTKILLYLQKQKYLHKIPLYSYAISPYLPKILLQGVFLTGPT